MRHTLLLATLAFAGAAWAADAPPDYSKPSSWACRPGQEGPCTTGLDAMQIAADGNRTPQPFVPAANAPIDCFYVYPTVSDEKQRYSSMALSPEVARVVQSQAGRLTAQCRVFAPIYRQLTDYGLSEEIGSGHPIEWSAPYADVLAAWRSYLVNDNHGRGVVIVGHSQGTILLQRLIAEQIDGKPARALLIAAFLAGDPSLPVPKGGLVGGVFNTVPLCTSAAQTGCTYVWGSYMADDASSPRRFGANPGGKLVGGCASPAAPGGGSGMLKAYLHKPAIAPEHDPPWIELIGQLAGQCTADDAGNVLRVTIQPGKYADHLRTALVSHHTGWGMHTLDVGFMQGNMLDVIAQESAVWVKR